MKTNCTRYDPKTGLCKLTNQPPKNCFDCAGYTYIPDNFSFEEWKFFDTHHPGFATDDVISEPWESMKHFQD